MKINGLDIYEQNGSFTFIGKQKPSPTPNLHQFSRHPPDKMFASDSRSVTAFLSGQNAGSRVSRIRLVTHEMERKRTVIATRLDRFATTVLA
jgi:hypothetical protein